MPRLIRRFCRDESGVTAIEYGLIATLVAFGIIGGASLIGTDLGEMFATVSNSL